MAEIKTIKNIKKYECEQSRYPHLPKTPFRWLLLAPSNSGKTLLIYNIIERFYKNCFEKVFIFSPNVFVDDSYKPIIEKYKERRGDKLYFDTYDETELNNIIEYQKKIVKHLKDNDRQKIYEILIVIDDFADDPSVSRNSTLLHNLYTKGRHYFINVIVSTQGYRLISPVIRKNISAICIFKLRNMLELQSVLEEFSAIKNKKILMKIYREATEERYSFLFINLNTSEGDLFYKNFTEKLI